MVFPKGGGIPARLRHAARLAVDTLLPPTCPGCDRELSEGRWLCGVCRRALRPAPLRPLCPACRAAQRGAGNREAGLDCRDPDHRGWRGAAAYWMEDPLAAVIHRFKYGDSPHLAEPLAGLVARRLPPPSAHGVLAVPLHPTRRRERGYDQAELLARALASRWGLPYVPGVVARRRSTRAQARLPESRRLANVAEAFSVAQPGWVEGRVWVVVDDVITTASTTGSVLSVLRVAGASGAVPVALALA